IKLIYPEKQEDSREAKGAGRDESVCENHGLARLGGVIAIDGCLYGLTIAHALGSHSPQDINGGTTLQSLKDSNSQSDALSFIDLRSQQHPEFKFSELDSDESCDLQEVAVPLGLGKYHDASSFFPKLATLHHGPPQHSDWALVQLGSNLELENSYVKSGSEELVDIVGVKSLSKLRSGEVQIIAGHIGIRAGALRDATASVDLHKSHFTVRQVRLQHRLECGHSGALVVQDDKLCGIIIAASGLVPWAYMLPIVYVFDDILLTVG
ncbi:hypothetical protein MMC29_004518, partial [Sticta canariensis]|nr:hypothetical protein [Sticta canariensis]